MSKRRTVSKQKSDDQVVCINVTGLEALCGAGSDTSVNSQASDDDDEDYEMQDSESDPNCIKCGVSRHNVRPTGAPGGRNWNQQQGGGGGGNWEMNQNRNNGNGPQGWQNGPRQAVGGPPGQTCPPGCVPRPNYPPRDANPMYGGPPPPHMHNHGPPQPQHFHGSPPVVGGQPCKACAYQPPASTSGTQDCAPPAPSMAACPPPQGCGSPVVGGAPGCPQQQSIPAQSQATPQCSTGQDGGNPTRFYSVNVTACQLGLEKLDAKFEKKKSVIEISCNFLLKTNAEKYVEDIDNIAKTLKAETEKSLANCTQEGGERGGCFQTTMLMNSAAVSELRKRGGGCSIPAWVKQG